jgi:hypothetical protein
MARKRATNVEAAAAAAVAAVAAQQEENPDLLELEEAAIEDDVLEGLRRMEQGGNRVTWYVYCDALDREGYIEKLRTEQLDEEIFKKRYGPGEYRVFGRTADGHYVKGSHKVVKISGVMSDTKAAAAVGNDAVTLLREMRAQEEARAAKRADDWKGIAAVVASPLATVLAALIARPRLDVAALVTALRPQQSTLAEMTTALVNLKQMQGESSGGVDVVLKVLERLQDMPSGGEGGGGWVGVLRDVIREAAPPVREMLGRIGQGVPPGQLPPGSTTGPPFGPGVQGSLPRPPTSSNGATAPTNTATAPLPSSHVAPTPGVEMSQPTTDSNMFSLAEPWLRRKAEDLHEYATTNMDCALVAEMFLESARKKFGGFITTAQLAELLRHPDWWAAVSGFHPPLAPYQAWCDDVRAELLGLLQEELTGAPPDERAEG